MQDILDFRNKEDFRVWLEENHDCGHGVTLFIYKKGYEDRGIDYESAVRTALCYGWIDSVTHSQDDIRFRQYFSKRKKGSNWSVSNIKRMKSLIDSGLVAESGLEHFDMKLIDQLDDLIRSEEQFRTRAVRLPAYVREVLKAEDALGLFRSAAKSKQRMYLHHVTSAKRQETRLARAHKIAELLKQEPRK